MEFMIVAVALLGAFVWHVASSWGGGKHRSKNSITLPGWVYLLWILTMAVFFFFGVAVLGSR